MDVRGRSVDAGVVIDEVAAIDRESERVGRFADADSTRDLDLDLNSIEQNRCYEDEGLKPEVSVGEYGSLPIP
ncbi:hypothetical protein LOK49_LG05G03592 [Camellia lanceoleosa]|uniref:Uncharacterized protein n=1 Tax=Camellia lanceoleosa TaxID=1840588 RepID=A0ACC0HK44_9ERIC|nr:hypothetical protein LOK49_LG05G03592 [Camellia lanceoleosa]